MYIYTCTLVGIQSLFSAWAPITFDSGPRTGTHSHTGASIGTIRRY